MKGRFVVLILLLAGLLGTCTPKKLEPGVLAEIYEGGMINVQGNRFIDSFGREVILSGFNYVNKDPGVNYRTKDSAEFYLQLNSLGINCLRIGIIWDGAEPEPGKYDDKYLNGIEQKVKWAGEHHIYVMLDMHQDLFGRKYSDGAPLWATLDDGQSHQTGAIWSDAYLMSAAIQRCFDNFWGNKPASDGIGIQDHYIALWKYLAKRFVKYKNVLGYDLMNEPFNGSGANMVMPLILTEYAKMLTEETGQAPPGDQELMMLWADENSRLKVLKKLAKADKYSRIIDAAFEPVRYFETTKLQPFYQRTADAVREEDSTHIIFLEHGYFSNTGIKTSIEPVKSKNGRLDPNQAYAAHAYDLIVDTKDADNQSNERVELIFTRISEASKRMNLPVLVGEWGAFYGMDSASIPSARFILALFERFKFGNTYWAYGANMENLPCFKSALLRPYPQFTSGVLSSYSYNHETGVFSCKWLDQPGVNHPTIIYIPDLKGLNKESIIITPKGKSAIIQSIEAGNGGYLIIPASGETLERTILFTLLSDPFSISIEEQTKNRNM